MSFMQTQSSNWESARDEEGNAYWINHAERITSWQNPGGGTEMQQCKKYLAYEWWKPTNKDKVGLAANRQRGCDAHSKTVSGFARLQARIRATRSRELHSTRVEEGKPWAPFVTTKMAVVRKMMEVTNAGPGDVVVDLGSGEGRICIVAALEHGARALGVEIDPVR